MFTFKEELNSALNDIRGQGLEKVERVLQGSQGAEISVNGKKVLNFCSNNYLGLANHPSVIAAAQQALTRWGYGLSSVRFICGTQEVHHELEQKLSAWLGTEDTILYSSCFDANGGLFETLTTEEDTILTDALNHASIIDGVRLSKAERKIYKHLDFADLETKLKESSSRRRRIIVTDGVFSMDGDITDLKTICDLADRYGALVVVDDSHATGFIGKGGRGTHEHNGVMGRIDIITSTLGKALGGAAGGFTSGRKEIIQLFRQRSRPYLFSNSLTPVIAATSIRVLDMVQENSELRQQLLANAKYFREQMTAAGFDIRPGMHPIVPVMLYDAEKAQSVARDLLAEGIYVIGFFYPVVPQGQARIRVQLSAVHTRQNVDRCIESFVTVGKKHGLVK